MRSLARWMLVFFGSTWTQSFTATWMGNNVTCAETLWIRTCSSSFGWLSCRWSGSRIAREHLSLTSTNLRKNMWLKSLSWRYIVHFKMSQCYSCINCNHSIVKSVSFWPTEVHPQTSEQLWGGHEEERYRPEAIQRKCNPQKGINENQEC